MNRPTGPAGIAPPPRERTRLSWPLLGFYTSCAVVALGATVAAAGWMWFRSLPALVVGIVMTAGSAVTCFTCLRKARAG